MLILGAKGHGKVIAEIAELNAIALQGFVDEDPEINQVWQYQVMHNLPKNARKLFLAIGDNQNRKHLFERFSEYEFPILIHPNASLSKRVQLGKGTAIMAGAVVNAEVKIGQQVILNTNCSVDHECQLGDFVHISPNASLAGNVEVGEGTQIGIGASVIQGIKIGRWAMIGAGAVIIRDVPDGATVVGNPGRIIQK